MSGLGVDTGDRAGIDYRERSPLVLPPSRDLPPPRGATPPTAIRPGRGKQAQEARRRRAEQNVRAGAEDPVRAPR